MARILCKPHISCKRYDCTGCVFSKFFPGDADLTHFDLLVRHYDEQFLDQKLKTSKSDAKTRLWIQEKITDLRQVNLAFQECQALKLRIAELEATIVGLNDKLELQSKNLQKLMGPANLEVLADMEFPNLEGTWLFDEQPASLVEEFTQIVEDSKDKFEVRCELLLQKHLAELEKLGPADGNVSKNRHVPMESIHKTEAEKTGEKTVSDQIVARRTKIKASREGKFARREVRFAQGPGEGPIQPAAPATATQFQPVQDLEKLGPPDGNVSKNKHVPVESIHKTEAEKTREEIESDQIVARRTKIKASREGKFARREVRFAQGPGEGQVQPAAAATATQFQPAQFSDDDGVVHDHDDFYIPEKDS